MVHIQQMSPHLADLIAAGEVVERPASVVKELVENSVDAGASSVTVEIRRGGMDMIRVTDDGSGIAAEEAETAFLRHATSKLHTEHDLEAIGTLGFRGEALAAIAAVSRADLMTRTADAPLGVAIHLEGGVVTEREESGCPVGTTMVIRDLFYNTPARLKFIRKDSAESAAVLSAVQREALAHPEISFTLIRDGRSDLRTPGDGQPKSALYSVLGRDLALGFLPVKGSGENEVKVSGFVSAPVCCRGTRGNQFFFVNGRWIKSQALTAALEQAYANQKMVGKFPCCVLYITTKLSAVDVNVHPAKTEIKFVSERQIFDAVYHTVKEALGGDPVRPAMQLQQTEPEQSEIPKQTGFFVPAGQAGWDRIPFGGDSSGTAAAWQKKIETQRRASEDFKSGQTAGTLQSPDWKQTERETSAGIPKAGSRNIACESHGKTPEILTGPSNSSESAENPNDVLPADPEPSEAERGQDMEQEKPPWRLVGQVLNTYIIVEQGDIITFIDKHAAHERMWFNKLKSQDNRPMSQILLTPQVFTLPPEESAILLENLPLIREFGFELEDFGGGSLILRQIPDYIDFEQAIPALSELAGQLAVSGGLADPSSAKDGMLHTMACKAAIKGGQINSDQELAVVADAVLNGNLQYCPHGRPVAIELSRKELEKQFKRA